MTAFKAYKLTVAAGESQSCAILTALCPMGLICVRGSIRENKGIEGSFIGDCASVYFCSKLADIYSVQ